MNKSVVAAWALAIALAGALGSLAATAPHLPPRMASHFDAAGTPDDWMERGAYLWLMAGLTLGLAALMVGVFYSIRYFPPSTINLPHRDYWLAPERRDETFDVMFRAGVWLAALQTAFLCGVHLLVVGANAAQPVRLSSHIWSLLGGFLAAIVVWGYFFIIRRFREAG